MDNGAAHIKDVDLVIITGAGASNRMADPPFPLMKEWRTSLQRRLQQEVPNFADLVGLNEDIEGAEFERRLGEFLGTALDFTSSEDLVARSIELPFVAHTMNHQAISDWRLQFSNALGRLFEEIYQSSFSEFGHNNLFNTKLAEESYGELLHALDIRPNETTWALATTNYDHVAEITLTSLGYFPAVGEERPTGGGGQFRLNARNLAAFATPYRTPVFHLHGSVGWFQKSNGQPYGLDSVANYNPSMGLPIMMLPNPRKNYESISLVGEIWREFRAVLKRAKSVLVLGHSLNDPELRMALGQDVIDGRRVAITQLTPNSEGPLRDSDEAKFATELGLTISPTIVPLNFGHPMEKSAVEAFDLWRARIEAIES
jgi:hypothetical protein